MNRPARDPITELAKGIYHIRMPGPAAHVYLLLGQRKKVLIDSGLPGTRDHLAGCLERLQVSLEAIDLVLLTHEHIDHSGGAAHFAGTALIGAHRYAANKLALRDEFALVNKAFGVTLEQDIPVDLLLDQNMVINLDNYELQVLHTPGHSSGSVCFYEPSHRLLFSGDTILSAGVVGGVLGSGNVSDYIHSLSSLASLKIDHLYPGHGNVSATADQDIRTGIRRLENLHLESKALFETMQHSRNSFDQILHSLKDLKID